MDILLEFQLEALAFKYLSFGFFTIINNLWTWVAVITAALSFWRFRTSLTHKSQLHAPLSNRNSDQPSDVTSSVSTLQPPSSAIAVAPSVCYDDDDCLTEGKFARYYYDCYERNRERDGEFTMDGGWDNYDRMKGGGYYSDGFRERHEGRERMRKGDLGWYCFQDLTMLNGNVVSLWDGGCSLSDDKVFH